LYIGGANAYTAEFPRFVARRRQNALANPKGFALQAGIVQLLYRRIESIAVYHDDVLSQVAFLFQLGYDLVCLSFLDDSRRISCRAKYSVRAG
jgi:hypothetical protein